MHTDNGLSMLKLLFFYMVLFSSACFAQEREIAITIDDLPLVASRMDSASNRQLAQERFTRIIEALTKYKVPVTGFVIAGAIAKGQQAFLKQFRQAGFKLGNHTYSHYNLNEMSAKEYIADIDHADKILGSLLPKTKYFRYPYLAEGNANTRQEVYDYLEAQHYIIAPVTINSKDYEFNAAIYKVAIPEREDYIRQLKPLYLAYIWEQTLKAEQRTGGEGKQILLLHANLLNSYLLGDVLQMYKKNGYRFISLAEALKNPALVIRFPDANRGTQLEDTLLLNFPFTLAPYKFEESIETLWNKRNF